MDESINWIDYLPSEETGFNYRSRHGHNDHDNSPKQGRDKDISSPRRRPNPDQRDSRSHHENRPNYRREENGLNPLRSPLNSEQRRSRINHNSRRRSLREDERSKKDSSSKYPLSPSKRNKASYNAMSNSSKSMTTLSVDSDEHNFRRRLCLPSEKDSDDDDDTPLDADNEDDKIILARREKQISYGKSTESYHLYISDVPKEDRGDNRKLYPRTPDKWRRCSRRNWDAQIKTWKKHIHYWANEHYPSQAFAPEKKKPVNNLPIEDVKENDYIDFHDDDEEDDSFLEGFELDSALQEDVASAETVSLL